MAIFVKKLVVCKQFSLSILSCRPSYQPMAIGFDNHPSEESRIIEIDYFRYRECIGKSLVNGVYSFTNVVCPLSLIKRLQWQLNLIDSGEDGCKRWHVKESADNLCMVRHMSAKTEGEADVSVNLDMDGAPKDLGYKIDISILGSPRIWRVLYNPSATLVIQRKPCVESDDDSFMVGVKLPAGLFHTNATTIETTECGDLNITLKKLKARKIMLLRWTTLT